LLVGVWFTLTRGVAFDLPPLPRPGLRE